MNIKNINPRSPEFLLTASIIILSLLYIASIFWRYPNGDEGLQAEHIYFLNNLGYVKSDIWAGYEFGWDIRQFHYHKGIVLLGLFATKLFGFSLPAIRIVSVIFYLWFTLLLYKYLKDTGHKKAELIYKISLLVLLVNTIFYEYIFIFRPEVMMMTLGFASFYHIDKGLKQNKVKFIISGGVFAGLAALMHLIGLTIMVAGGLTILFRKNIKFAIIFSVFAILALCIYFYDLLSKQAFDGFVFQFFNEASIANKQESPFGKVLEEHMRFFNSPKEILFSLIFFLSLVVNFNYLRKNFFNLLVFGLGSIVALAFLAPNTTNKYALLYYPFMGVVIALSIVRLKEFKKTLQVFVLIFLALFTGYHLYLTGKMITNGVNIKKQNEEIAAKLPEKNVNIFAAESFVFNQIENYTIHSWLAFHRYYTKRQPGYKPTRSDFMLFCDKLDDKYILFEKALFGNELFHYLEPDKIKVGDVWDMYEVIVSEPELLILENTRLK